MKWSYEWLKQYLDTDLTPAEIADKLTAIGLEVENLYVPILPIAAKIVECKPHENSDHMHVLMVDDGSGKLRQVVCGAPNVRVGLVSALAIPGCKIGDMVIQSGKLRGVVSDGMMCSGRELGINNDHDGIIELDEKIEVIGQPISVLANKASAVLETSITPNRPDYLSVRGIALDLSAAGVGKYIENKIDDLKELKGDRKVNLMAPDACPTYRFCEIRGIKNAPSNKTIQARLLSADINPKNAPIDTTNYICYDLAQPMHCFDADKIVGDITVRMANNGEKFTDLFGTEYELCDKDLVICDDAGVLALAGVVGGERSCTSDNTKNIILESAYFNPVTVRKTSKRYGISTDSSYRYERGINPDGTGAALALAAKIIMDECGGKIVNVSVAGRTSYTPESVVYNPSLLEQKTGIKIDAKTQKEILKKLHFGISENKKGDWVITPNPQRTDIVIPETIVSELVRIYGYDKIGLKEMPKETVSTFHKDIDLELKQKLANRGLNETITFGFGNSKVEKLVTDKPIINVANPIIVDLDTARNNLIGNLLIAVANNEKRGFSDINIFELGTVFDGDTPGAQHTSICIVRCGVTSPKHWMKRNRNVDLFDVKSDLVSLLGAQRYTLETNNVPVWAHPYRYGRIVQGKKVLGEFGQLHPSVAKQMHIKTDVFIGLVEDIENLPKNPKYQKIPVTDFQPITRDFAFIVPNDFPAANLVTAARGVSNLISDITVFDSFAMSDGNKSVAFSVTIIPTEKMSDGDLAKLHGDIIAAVEKKCPAHVRDK
ncbi:MAG: phenylalanine--tRNA ligase subunit beta [Alphaproteobacteria bacterium]|nr:phenylalanine--tRNA ligase subunit beta [Alphaproteobacteria bacterium]